MRQRRSWSPLLFRVTQVYGGFVVLIDIPTSSFSLDHVWDPMHYAPTMPLTAWTPVLPPQPGTVSSYVHFLDNPTEPSRFFQQDIYVGTIPGSTVGEYLQSSAECSYGAPHDSNLGLLRDWRGTFCDTRNLIVPCHKMGGRAFLGGVGSTILGQTKLLVCGCDIIPVRHTYTKKYIGPCGIK